MEQGARIDALDGVPRPVIALGSHYPDGQVIPPHLHRRGQLITGVSGVIVLATPQGTWVMPPQRGMWIPPGTLHDVRMVGAVTVQSLYLEPEAARGMPRDCQVVGIPPFMRSLMAEAMDVPVDYDPESRAGAVMTLIQHEIRRLPVLPLSLPHPVHEAVAARCREFLRAPGIHETIDDWIATLGMSRRTFTRLFRRETGLSFVDWRQQACLISAVPRLAAGETVTAVALDLGYDNPAAFAAMFRRVLGASPSRYFGRGD